MVEERLKEAWVRVLSSIYSSVDWRKMAGSKSSRDVFAHRVEFSMGMQSVGKFLQRLGDKLGIQALPSYLSEEDLEVLMQDEKRSMRFLRENAKLLVFFATRKSKKKDKSLEDFMGGE